MVSAEQQIILRKNAGLLIWNARESRWSSIRAHLSRPKLQACILLAVASRSEHHDAHLNLVHALGALSFHLHENTRESDDTIVLIFFIYSISVTKYYVIVDNRPRM